MAIRPGTEIPRPLEDTPGEWSWAPGDRSGEYPAHELGLGEPFGHSPPLQSPIHLRVYVQTGLLHDVKLPPTTHKYPTHQFMSETGGSFKEPGSPIRGEPGVAVIVRL